MWPIILNRRHHFREPDLHSPRLADSLRTLLMTSIGGMILMVFTSGCGWLVSTMGIDGRPPPPDLPHIPIVGVWHPISPGDTLGELARRYHVSLQDVAELNDLPDPDRIYVGDELFIPGADVVLGAHNRPQWPAREPPTKRDGDLDKPKLEKGIFIWPVESGGRISSRFGIRRGRQHDGLDIAAPSGVPILAAADGTVIHSNNVLRGYGNLVIIEHNQRYSTVYAHNKRNLVKEGDRVQQGQKIAEVGSTGRSTGPHLHFEIRDNGKARNPLFFLDEPK